MWLIRKTKFNSPDRTKMKYAMKSVLNGTDIVNTLLYGRGGLYAQSVLGT